MDLKEPELWKITLNSDQIPPMNRFVLFTAFIFQFFFSEGQTPYPSQEQTLFTCGTDAKLRFQRTDPLFQKQEAAFNARISSMLHMLPGDTLTLPVVVHIIRNNPFSVTDADVVNGIQDLNDAFSKSGPYAASAGADTKIRFCLAKKDPIGGITNGITRTSSIRGESVSYENEDERLKALTLWDPLRYINIWLVSNVEGEAYSKYVCGVWTRLRVGGYATMPPGGGPTDGIVVPSFGTVLAHEMGHYLGLYHTFEGGCYNANCLNDGDRVCDTPPDNNVLSAPSCSAPGNSCNTDTQSNFSNLNFFTDVPDQIANFMDYGNGSCHIEFTQGQADRMRASILTSRAGLLVDECSPPCGDNILAGFTRNIADPVPGDVINFTNTSTGATNFEWLVNGVVVSTSINFSFSPSAMGRDTITLKAFNIPGCFSSYTDFIITRCGVTSRFWGDKVTIASMTGVWEDSIKFTNNSANATSFVWQISTDASTWTNIATSTNLTYIFPAAGTYYVRLIATNGSCSDTTANYRVPVDNPTADGSPFDVVLKCYNGNRIKIDFCLVDWGYAPLPQNSILNFYDGNPALPGTHRLSPAMLLPYNVPGGNCYMCFSHTLVANYYHIEQVWMVFNDAGTAIPVSLPNSSFPEKNYNNNTAASQFNRTYITATICEGTNYAGHTTTGIYIDTLVSQVNGCDSVRTLNLTVKPRRTTTINASICSGQSYAGHTTTGTYIETFPAANGCDSIRTLNLIVKPLSYKTVDTSICAGENYAGHNTSGTYIDNFTAANGCDSIRTLHLLVLPVFATIIDTAICQGEQVAGYTTTGTYVDVFTAANGCDSTRTLHLTVKNKKFTTYNIAICLGQSQDGYTSSGTYIDVFTGANGCDSTRTLNLTVKNPVFSTITTAICDGENAEGYSTSGTYTDVFTGSNGCDSTRTLNLTVKPNSTTSYNITICEGENYAGHTTTGTYVDVFPSANGCDSSRTLVLQVNPVKYTHFYPEICKGQTYTAGGHAQTTSGTYYDTLSTYLLCDSILVTHLHVRNLPKPQLGPDRGFCLHGEIVLNPGTFTSYLWQDGSTSPVLHTHTLGQYHVLVKDDIGCEGRDTVNVNEIYRLPQDFVTGDTSVCRGNIIKLMAQEFENYLWSTGSTAQSIQVTHSGNYSVWVTDTHGCKGEDSALVYFYTDCKDIVIPNAFTPNDDYLNDSFKPLIPAPVTQYRMQIWNRWGQRVFETNKYTEGWDGRYKYAQQATGTYIYTISFRNIDGQYVYKKGTLILIR